MRSSFEQWMLKEKYAKVRGLGDRLVFMKELINWKSFIPIVRSVFRDNAKTGGRPEGGFEEAKQIWQLTKGKPAVLDALCRDDIEGLRALGLSTEESRLLLFLKGRMIGEEAGGR